MKKSWHPLLQVNQERVWKREKEALEERKKLEELRRERDQEREMQELQRLQEEAGGKKRIDRVDWMYATPATTGSKSAAEMEDYLLGKKRVDKLLQGDKAEKVSKNASNGPISLQNANSARDLAAKVREDPMLAIKQQEQAAYEALLRDPARLRQLKAQAGIDVDADNKEERRRRKEEKRRRHDDDDRRRRRDDDRHRRHGSSRHHDSSSDDRSHRHRDDRERRHRDRDDSNRREDGESSRHRSHRDEHRSSRRHHEDERGDQDRDRYRNDHGREQHHEGRHRDQRRSPSPRWNDDDRLGLDGHNERTSRARDHDSASQPAFPRSRSRSPVRDRRTNEAPAPRFQERNNRRDDRHGSSSYSRPSGPSARNREEDEKRKEETRKQKLREMEQNAKSMQEQRSSYVNKINADEAEQDRKEAELRQKLLDARAKGHSDGKGAFIVEQQRKTFGDNVDLAERMRRDRGKLQRLD